jgi:hypothetical protein
MSRSGSCNGNCRIMYIYCSHVELSLCSVDSIPSMSYKTSINVMDKSIRKSGLSLPTHQAQASLRTKNEPIWVLAGCRNHVSTFRRTTLCFEAQTHIMISYSLKRANLASSCLNAAINESILDFANFPFRSCLKVSATAKLGSKTSSTRSPLLRLSIPTIVIECPGLWK